METRANYVLVGAFAIAGFFVVHIVLVILAGPIRQIRDMITGGREG